jgi:hypothetical protein
MQPADNPFMVGLRLSRDLGLPGDTYRRFVQLLYAAMR